MKRILLTLTAALSIATISHAELKTQTIEYKQGDTVLEGYLAYDDSFAGMRPGVLVVHEWKGLDAYAKMRADMLAKLGYVAFAADIYGKGIRPADPKEAGEQAGKYKGNRVLLRERVLAGLSQLSSQGNVDTSKLAAIGYCFGGTAVLELARAGADVRGVVSFHGGLSSPTPEDAKNIKTRILILHGADDPFAPAEEVAALEKELKDHKVQHQIILYPNAQHGFTNPANTGTMKGALYNKEADEKSWDAMKKFLSEIFI
jgi:dienelactone hydrolase